MSPVNVEMLVRDYLAADAGVAALVGARVYTQLPPEPTFPLVVVSRFAGAAADWGHLDAARLQIDSWAEKKQRPAAHDLFMAVRTAMASQNIRGEYTLGVVAGCQEVNALWQPDAVSDGRPRYILDVRLWCHPRTTGSVNVMAPTVAAGADI